MFWTLAPWKNMLLLKHERIEIVGQTLCTDVVCQIEWIENIVYCMDGDHKISQFHTLNNMLIT